MRLLITKDDGTFLCGGSIYNESYIITAAHCIVDSAGAVASGIATTVYAGDLDKSSTSESSEQSVTV